MAVRSFEGFCVVTVIRTHIYIYIDKVMEYQYIVIEESGEEEEEQQQLRTVALVSRLGDQYTISNFVASVRCRLEERRRRNVVRNRSPSVSIFKIPSRLTGINYKCTQPEMVSTSARV